GGRTKQATAELAGHLTTRGYLESRPDPNDGRAKLYVATARGRKLLKGCERIVDEYEDWLNRVLGPGGVDQLRAGLTDIVNHGPTHDRNRGHSGQPRYT